MDEQIGRRMLDSEPPGRQGRGRPKRRSIDVIEDDMGVAKASEEDMSSRTRGKSRICYGDS